MRKNKGRLTYYLEVIDKKYHFVKKISSYSKEFADGKTKRTKRTLSELVFNESEVEAIDFTKNGLRPVDKNILLTMVKEYKESDA
ncbi:hypothetical protein [Escherichia coli]|uniref:hypothetical protein n=1 Tax=Escherichia coli TaxID=562 RepID=UPI001331971C|nr:hypothetical protein [Escherichia coli]